MHYLSALTFLILLSLVLTHSFTDPHSHLYKITVSFERILLFHDHKSARCPSWRTRNNWVQLLHSLRLRSKVAFALFLGMDTSFIPSFLPSSDSFKSFLRLNPMYKAFAVVAKFKSDSLSEGEAISLQNR